MKGIKSISPDSGSPEDYLPDPRPGDSVLPMRPIADDPGAIKYRYYIQQLLPKLKTPGQAPSQQAPPFSGINLPNQQPADFNFSPIGSRKNEFDFLKPQNHKSQQNHQLNNNDSNPNNQDLSQPLFLNKLQKNAALAEEVFLTKFAESDIFYDLFKSIDFNNNQSLFKNTLRGIIKVANNYGFKKFSQELNKTTISALDAALDILGGDDLAVELFSKKLESSFVKKASMIKCSAPPLGAIALIATILSLAYAAKEYFLDEPPPDYKAVSGIPPSYNYNLPNMTQDDLFNMNRMQLLESFYTDKGPSNLASGDPGFLFQGPFDTTHLSEANPQSFRPMALNSPMGQTVNRPSLSAFNIGSQGMPSQVNFGQDFSFDDNPFSGRMNSLNNNSNNLFSQFGR